MEIPENVQVVLGSYINQLHSISNATRQRWLISGKLPPPDLPAKRTGEPHRWLKSTIDNHFKNMLNGEAA